MRKPFPLFITSASLELIESAVFLLFFVGAISARFWIYVQSKGCVKECPPASNSTLWGRVEGWSYIVSVLCVRYAFLGLGLYEVSDFGR